MFSAQVNILFLKDEDFNLSIEQVFDLSIDFGDKNKSLGVEQSKSYVNHQEARSQRIAIRIRLF